MGAWTSFLVRAFLLFVSLLSKTIGFLVICIACVLITTVIYTHTHVVLPAIYQPGTWGYYFWYGVTVWLATGVWLNYLGSLGCTPGTIPSGFLIQSPKGSDNSKPNSGKICYFCNCSKAERVHHCSFCGHCVQKMDHHCPWINNCVGYRNQRYFNGFLLYLLVGTFFCMSFTLYVNYYSERFPRQILLNHALTLNLIICMALFVAMLGFVTWNMHLALSNQTAIETHINMDAKTRAKNAGVLYRNPFHLGRWRNFLAVFLTRGEKHQWFRYYAKGFWDSRGKGFEGVTCHNYNAIGKGDFQQHQPSSPSSPLGEQKGASSSVSPNDTVSATTTTTTHRLLLDDEERGVQSTTPTTAMGPSKTYHPTKQQLPLLDRVADGIRILIHERILGSNLSQWVFNPAAKLLGLCGGNRSTLERHNHNRTELPKVLHLWFHRRLVANPSISCSVGGGKSSGWGAPSLPTLAYTPGGLFDDFRAVITAILEGVGCACLVQKLDRLKSRFRRSSSTTYSYSSSSSSSVSLLFPSVPVAKTNQSLLEALAFLLCSLTWIIFWRAGDLVMHGMLCIILVWPNVQETVDEGMVYPRWTDDVVNGASNSMGPGVVLTSPPPQ